MDRRIFGIGETVLDITFKGTQPITAKAGGSVLNTMVSLARTGHDVHFISEIGDDAIGDLVIEFLQANKVGQRYVTRYANGQTPLALAFLNAQNDASYEFYKPYPSQRAINLPNSLTPNDVIMFGSFHAINHEIREFTTSLLQMAKNAGSLVIYDPNFRHSHAKEGKLDGMAKENMMFSSIVRGSNEDFVNLFGAKNVQEIKANVSGFCPNIVVTNGANGIDLIAPNANGHFNVDTISPLSTIGAGDNFNAGIINAIIDMGITPSSLDELSIDTWTQIIAYGKEFSKTVCLSTDNYVDEGFVHRLPFLLKKSELNYEWKWGKED
ncbi:MAG: PfkB family carbohydrate kinase [Breznakibacter sp.]